MSDNSPTDISDNSASIANQTGSRQQPSSGSKWQLRAIILVSVLPLIAAYVAYYTGWGVSGATVNKGTIISPVLNIKQLIQGTAGQPDWDKNIWRIILPVPQDCDAQCQNHLYLTRQVHIRLGEKADRIERFAINLGEDRGRSYIESIKAEHPKLKTFEFDPSQWQTLLAASNVPKLSEQHAYLLMDPQGFAMMYYTAANEGGELLKDIKKILRYAPED